MAKFFNEFKKTCFWTIFGPFSQFSEQKIFFWKISLCHTQLHINFQHRAKIQKKTNYTIPRIHPNRWKDGRTEGRKDGRSCFTEPFRPPPGVQQDKVLQIIAVINRIRELRLYSDLMRPLQKQSPESVLQKRCS